MPSPNARNSLLRKFIADIDSELLVKYKSTFYSYGVPFHFLLHEPAFVRHCTRGSTDSPSVNTRKHPPSACNPLLSSIITWRPSRRNKTLESFIQQLDIFERDPIIAKKHVSFCDYESRQILTFRGERLDVTRSTDVQSERAAERFLRG